MSPSILPGSGEKNNMTNADELGNQWVSPVDFLGNFVENILQKNACRVSGMSTKGLVIKNESVLSVPILQVLF